MKLQNSLLSQPKQYLLNRMKSPAFQMPFRHGKTTQKALGKLLFSFYFTFFFFSPRSDCGILYLSVFVFQETPFQVKCDQISTRKSGHFLPCSLCPCLRILWCGALKPAMPGAGQAGSHLCSLLCRWGPFPHRAHREAFVLGLSTTKNV